MSQQENKEVTKELVETITPTSDEGEITDLKRKMNDTFDTANTSSDEEEEDEETKEEKCEGEDDDGMIPVEEAAVDVLDNIIGKFEENTGRTPTESELWQLVEAFKSVYIQGKINEDNADEAATTQEATE